MSDMQNPEPTFPSVDPRRIAFQLALADRLRPLSSAAEVVAAASEMLCRQLDVSRVAYVEIEPDQETSVIEHQWAQAGVSPIPGALLHMDTFGPAVVALLRAGRTLVVEDVLADPRTAPYSEGYAAIEVRANVAVPLVQPQGLAIVLSVQARQPRAWTDLDIALAQDVAERTWVALRAASVEAKLRESQARLSAVFDILPDGIGVFDTDGSVQLCNQAMLRYLPNRTLPSRDQERASRWQAVDADGTPLRPPRFPGRRALDGERVVPGIELLYTPDEGLPVWTEVVAVPIRDANGHVSGQVSVVHDIDTLKRAEAAARELARDLAAANDRQTEFLAVLAHELRNPLAPIVTALELLRVRGDSPEIAARAREIMERQTGQIVHLLDDLLDIARVSSGKIQIRRQRIDLQAAIATAVETSRPVIETAGHELRVQWHEEPLPLQADPTRLAQIVSNLLTNAAKYTPSGGQILLTVRREGDAAVVAVKDNGIGVAAEAIGSIFGMFSQLRTGGGAAPGGLGIGLALVQQLVALHGGTVSAASGGPGQGSTFTVRLPLAAAPLPEEVRPLGSGTQSAAHVLRVLVADDNVDAAESLSTLLAVQGHETLMAHDGPQALRVAAETNPDVVVLDIGMPGMDGYEVARQMRADATFRTTTLVAVTGWGTAEDRARAREAGFDAHLTKPVALDQLNLLLERVAPRSGVESQAQPWGR